MDPIFVPLVAAALLLIACAFAADLFGESQGDDEAYFWDEDDDREA